MPHLETVNLGDAILANGVGVAAVAALPDDPRFGALAGKPALWVQFALGCRRHTPILYANANADLTGFPSAVQGAIDELPTPEVPVVRCPGCNLRLHGPVADRGACLGCFPAVPGGDR